MNNSLSIKTITAYHQFRELPPPKHPLFSIIDLSQIKRLREDEPKNMMFDFYAIGYKKMFNGKVRYGQQQYDFDGGILAFTAPKQLFGIELEKGEDLQQSGKLLLIDPDFLWQTTLSQKIKQFDFFDYSINEALFLSVKEEAIVERILQNIELEYQTHIDKHFNDIIVAQLESLLAYSERFYERQFITRKKVSSELISRLDKVLDSYFSQELTKGATLPSVTSIAYDLNVSPGYLSSMLKSLTGMNTQQHIHAKVIEKAKEMLTTTNLTVGQIAYSLGFEHIQSFSSLFKAKTNQTPLKFRQSFN